MMNQRLYIPFILFIAMFFTLRCSKNIPDKNKVKQGEFKVSLTESGELQAMNSKVITMPYLGNKFGWNFQIIGLEEHGAQVKKGDVVAEIDNSPILKVLEQEKSRFELEMANLEKLNVTQNSQISQITAEYESEKSNFELIKLQVDKYQFETESKQIVKQKELEIAAIRLKKTENKLKLVQEVFRNNLKIQNIKLEQIKKSIAEAEAALGNLELISPNDGIFQLDRNRRTRRTVQVGDEISMGQTFARIPDMSRMKVISTINESDISKVKLNQVVIVRLDAYPEKEFYGKINYLGKLSRQKDRNNPVKVFDLEILMTDSDPALKPGMTVSCEIITHQLKDVLFIENVCIVKDSVQYYVCEKKGNSVKKIPIKLIARNSQFSAIEGELEKGQKLLSVSELQAED